VFFFFLVFFFLNLCWSFRTGQNKIKDKNQPGLHRFELRSCKILTIEQIAI